MGKIKYNHNRIAQLYQRGMNTREVAAIVGCSNHLVSTVARQYGISRPRLTRKHILNKRAKSCGLLSDNFSKYLDGLMISDGHLLRPSNNVKTSGYQQTCVNEEWLVTINETFGRNGIESNIGKESRKAGSYCIKTKRYIELF